MKIHLWLFVSFRNDLDTYHYDLTQVVGCVLLLLEFGDARHRGSDESRESGESKESHEGGGRHKHGHHGRHSSEESSEESNSASSEEGNNSTTTEGPGNDDLAIEVFDIDSV